MSCKTALKFCDGFFRIHLGCHEGKVQDITYNICLDNSNYLLDHLLKKSACESITFVNFDSLSDIKLPTLLLKLYVLESIL